MIVIAYFVMELLFSVDSVHQILSFFFMVQVGNEERIHVYYAHGEDSPTFVRRCYWLLDKYVIITVYLEPLMTLLFYTCIS